MNATCHIGLNQRADIFIADYAFTLGKLRNIAAITHCEVLQFAFAALVAYRAVQGMVNEEKFHRRVLSINRFLRTGADLHPVHYRRRTCRHGFRCFFDLNQTHPAVSRDTQMLVVAKARDVDACGVGRLNQHRAFADLKLLSVNFDFDCIVAHE